MDWKDTVLRPSEVLPILNKKALLPPFYTNLGKVLEAQAEISFKEGQEKGYLLGLHSGIYDGRREVVEWIQTESLFTQKALDGQVWITKEQWQAKLKDWNVLD